MLPFDLHVLGLPPAFTLSQDQTLHLKLRSPKANNFSCRNSTTGNVSLALKQLNHCLIKRLQDGQSSTPAGVLTRYLRILSKNFGIGLSAFFQVPDVSVEASRPL